MSSSPPPLVPPVASPDSHSLPLSPPRYGSSPPPRSLQDLRIHDNPALPAGGSRRQRRPPAPPTGASLNPFAKEFVPGSSPANEGFLAPADSRGQALGVSEPCVSPSSSSPEIGSERLSGGALSEGNRCEGFEPSNHSQRPSGLSTALKGGHAGQNRTLVASGGQVRHGGSDGISNQTVVGTTGVGRRAQFSNANHLLNFQYDPIIRSAAPRTIPSTRRPHRSQPYNKELFLQANFRFLVSDFGDYLLNSSDPDKMLQWEDIAAVNVSAPVPLQCSICLENPLVCPQITSCGHIFCFPCILRYLVMGEEEPRSDYFKKCPLCFAMISSKALRTVSVQNVHNYQVGDHAEFTLLNRAKGSIIPFEKNDPILGALPYSKDGQYHPFSKFTLTSDAEQTANRAIAELSSWAAKSDKETAEDMDVLPFVFAAIDQLQQRKTEWGEHRVSGFLSSSPPVRQRIMAQTKEATTHFSSHGSGLPVTDEWGYKSTSRKNLGGEKTDVTAETEAAMAELRDKSGWVYENAFSDDEKGGESGSSQLQKQQRGEGVDVAAETDAELKDKCGSVYTNDFSDDEEGGESRKGRVITSKGRPSRPESHRAISKCKVPSKHADIPSTREENSLEEPQFTEKPDVVTDVDKHPEQDLKKDVEDRESYAFYQSADGQPLILHPLNMKCLLQHYGGYENLPSRLQGRIVEMEGQIQTEATRKRYRYLSHLPLTTNFWLCEVDLRGILPSSALSPFIGEIRVRENRRRRRLKQEQAECLREGRISTAPTQFLPSSEPVASMDYIEAEELPLGLDLEETNGGTSLPSASVSVDQRKLFSQVTRLGFASAHDAPDLTPSKSSHLSSSEASVSKQYTASGDITSKQSSTSFADIIQAPPAQVVHNGTNGPTLASQASSKKSRKAAKVLLSTAGGRRY